MRLGARDYDPTLGRFTAMDPALFDGGDTNLYAFLAGDPMNGTDPTGLGPKGGVDTDVEAEVRAKFTPMLKAWIAERDRKGLRHFGGGDDRNKSWDWLRGWGNNLAIGAQGCGNTTHATVAAMTEAFGKDWIFYQRYQDGPLMFNHQYTEAELKRPTNDGHTWKVVIDPWAAGSVGGLNLYRDGIIYKKLGSDRVYKPPLPRGITDNPNEW